MEGCCTAGIMIVKYKTPLGQCNRGDRQATFLTGIFHRYRENFLPCAGFTSAVVAMRYMSGIDVEPFLKSSPLCHKKGALLMSVGSNPGHASTNEVVSQSTALPRPLALPWESME